MLCDAAPKLVTYQGTSMLNMDADICYENWEG